jgi:hypothetical protein
MMTLAPMRLRFASVLGLSLVAGSVGSCSSPSAPDLGTCCVVDDQGTSGPVCFCGSSSTAGTSFVVKVSGSTCTVTNTNEGGPGATAQGQPPASQADCVNPVGS